MIHNLISNSLNKKTIMKMLGIIKLHKLFIINI